MPYLGVKFILSSVAWNSYMSLFLKLTTGRSVVHLQWCFLSSCIIYPWFADCMSVVILQVSAVLNGQRHAMQKCKHLQWFQLLSMVVLFVLGKLLSMRWHTGKIFFPWHLFCRADFSLSLADSIFFMHIIMTTKACCIY